MAATTIAAGVGFTTENLLAAYQGEINARARYIAFAAQAEAEGFAGIASLFRAAARAEQIHANNQARVLRQMGAEATAEVYAYAVRTTLENLTAALSGENYEIGTMYPAFIEEATARINSTAARSFQWSLEAEKTHAELYSEAIGLLEQEQMDSWIVAARTFYVCPVCACTSKDDPAENCIVCQYPSHRAETIC